MIDEVCLDRWSRERVMNYTGDENDAQSRTALKLTTLLSMVWIEYDAHSPFVGDLVLIDAQISLKHAVAQRQDSYVQFSFFIVSSHPAAHAVDRKRDPLVLRLL